MKNESQKDGKKLSFFHPIFQLATIFGVGKSPIVPGTMGSLAGFAMVVFLFYQPHEIYIKGGELFYSVGDKYINREYLLYIMVALTCFWHLLGAYVSDIYARRMDRKDPKEVVIDEVAGIFTTFTLVGLVFSVLLSYYPDDYLIYFSLMGYYFVAIFILFRFFDMFKIWHVKWADEKLEGGFGIMMDDQIAALYAAITFITLFHIARATGLLDNMLTI